jgi:hypothetical protein
MYLVYQELSKYKRSKNSLIFSVKIKIHNTILETMSSKEIEDNLKLEIYKDWYLYLKILDELILEQVQGTGIKNPKGLLHTKKLKTKGIKEV